MGTETANKCPNCDRNRTADICKCGWKYKIYHIKTRDKIDLGTQKCYYCGSEIDLEIDNLCNTNKKVYLCPVHRSYEWTRHLRKYLPEQIEKHENIKKIVVDIETKHKMLMRAKNNESERISDQTQ